MQGGKRNGVPARKDASNDSEIAAVLRTKGKGFKGVAQYIVKTPDMSVLVTTMTRLMFAGLILLTLCLFSQAIFSILTITKMPLVLLNFSQVVGALTVHSSHLHFNN